MRDSSERQYTKDWLQYERQQPMHDESINEFYGKIFRVNPVHRDTTTVDVEFINTFVDWLESHELSCFEGIDKFPVKHVIQGVTHFIDDLYQRCGELQIFRNDYKYHWRLNNDIEYVEKLNPNKELLISMPFPYYGDVHPDMYSILDECEKLNIPVHIDSAWVSCIRDINFNYDHPAIKTFAISLSKAGLGGNRIGVRFAREEPLGSITIINNFNMNQQPLMHIGLKFMNYFGPEYFWKKYETKYNKVCRDFNLKPTKTVHLAIDNDKPVGVRSLLRAL